MEKKKLSIKEIGIEKLVIMLLAGIFLILLSFPNFFASPKKETTYSDNSSTIKTTTGNEGGDNEYVKHLEQRLETVLRKVEGIGDVKVMITVKSSKELVTLKDKPYSQETINETDSSGGTRIQSNIQNEEESIMKSTTSGGSEPYVIKEIEPEVEGVVVIAKGGGNQTIINEINDAVQVLFGVPPHKIKVMKMNLK